MSQGSILIVLGLVTVVAPFSGLPLSWIEILLPLIGLAVALIGYLSRKSDSHPISTLEDTALVS